MCAVYVPWGTPITQHRNINQALGLFLLGLSVNAAIQTLVHIHQVYHHLWKGDCVSIYKQTTMYVVQFDWNMNAKQVKDI